MEFFRKVLEVLDTEMERPCAYGWFHLLFFALSLGVAVLLCALYHKGYIKNVKKVVFITAVTVIVLEVYKIINYGFSYTDGIEFSFPWSAFPWQFCSMPMYVGFLAGLTRGKIHDVLCCFLATFAVFADVSKRTFATVVITSTGGITAAAVSTVFVVVVATASVALAALSIPFAAASVAFAAVLDTACAAACVGLPNTLPRALPLCGASYVALLPVLTP